MLFEHGILFPFIFVSNPHCLRIRGESSRSRILEIDEESDIAHCTVLKIPKNGQKDNWSSDNWSFDNWARDNWASGQLVFWTTGLIVNWTFTKIEY